MLLDSLALLADKSTAAPATPRKTQRRSMAHLKSCPKKQTLRSKGPTPQHTESGLPTESGRRTPEMERKDLEHKKKGQDVHAPFALELEHEHETPIPSPADRTLLAAAQLGLAHV